MKKIILTVALLSFAAGVCAQQNIRTLSFDEALDMTMTNNPRITASQFEEKAAEQERKAAFGLRLPQIGVTGAYVYMGDDIGVGLNGVRDGAKGMFEGVAGGLGAAGITLPPGVLQEANALFGKNWNLTLQERDFATVAGTVKMPVYMGGKINAANRAAKINEKTAQKEGILTRNALLSELVERYFGLSLANSVVRVREQVYVAVQHHLKDAIALEQNGVIARSERLYLEVKVAEAERDLMSARLRVQTISSALKNTVNDQTDYVPISNMFMLSTIDNAEHFQSLAHERNPQLHQVELKKQLAQENVKVMRSEFLPHIALMGGYNFYNYQVSLSKAMPDWVVGAGVKINLFDGLHKEYKFSAAKNTVRRIEAMENKAANDIEVLIDNLYAEMRNYADRVPSIDTSMKFAKEYLRVKKAGFAEGVASSVDVIDAELNLAKTRIEKLQTAYYYDLMLARLLEAAGASENFVVYQRSAAAIPVAFEE